MKYQQVSVDFVNMVFTACSYLALAGAAWIFLRLLQACFWLPRHLRKQNDVQQMLQDKVDSYEKYLLECEEKEKEAESGDTTENSENVSNDKNNTLSEEKRKERRECLEMLKRELKRVKEGGDIYDWDYLLEDDNKPEDECTSEVADTDETKKNDATSINEIDCKLVDVAPINEEVIEEKKEK